MRLSCHTISQLWADKFMIHESVMNNFLDVRRNMEMETREWIFHVSINCCWVINNVWWELTRKREEIHLIGCLVKAPWATMRIVNEIWYLKSFLSAWCNPIQRFAAICLSCFKIADSKTNLLKFLKSFCHVLKPTCGFLLDLIFLFIENNPRENNFI